MVPEKHELEAAAKQLGVSGSCEEICKNSKVGCTLPDNAWTFASAVRLH